VQAVADRQRRDALRRAVREADAGPRPHRLADQRRLVHAQMVEQRGQIVDEGAAPTPIQIARQAEAAMVEGDDAVRARQGIELPIPDRVVAADAVRQHDRRSLPMRLPIEFGARSRQHTAFHHDTPINLLSRTT